MQQEESLTQSLRDQSAGKSARNEIEVAALKAENNSLATPLGEAKKQHEQCQERLRYKRKCNRTSWDDLTREEQGEDGEEEAFEPSFRQEWPTVGETRREEPPPVRPQQAPYEAMRGLKPEEGLVPKRKEADSVRIPNLPKAPQFRSWKLATRDEVASASGDPDAGFKGFVKSSYQKPPTKTLWIAESIS